MTKKFYPGLISIVAVVLLGGCSKEPPKCSDDATFSLMRKIIVGEIGVAPGITDKEIQESMKFETARAAGFDEKLKTYQCEATMVAGPYQFPLQYVSQLNDQNKHLVLIRNVERIRAVYALQDGIAGIVKSKAAPKPTAAAPEASAQVKPSEQIATAPQSGVPAAPAPAPAQNPSVSVVTFAPSFDCSKAASAAEKSICSDPLLGKLDGTLAQNYKFMLASNIGEGAKSDLKQTQKKWLSQRNQCKTNECLVSAYRSRVDEVCEYPVISGVHPVCVSAADIK